MVGLIGGVGSGKSAVTNWLQEHYPLVTIDGDRVGHAVLCLPHIRQQLVERFGTEILDSSGEIVRSRLGAQVWGNTEERIEARKALEAIVHPEIRREMERQIAEARESGQCGVVLDAAVMLESGWASICDRIIFIDVPAATREQRVLANRGWTSEQWKEREKSQFSLEEKKRRADFVIDNSGPVEQAGEQLARYLHQELGWEPTICPQTKREN